MNGGRPYWRRRFQRVTKRERETLAALVKWQDEHDHRPKYIELGRVLGVSGAWARQMLEHLAAKGCLWFGADHDLLVLDGRFCVTEHGFEVAARPEYFARK